MAEFDILNGSVEVLWLDCKKNKFAGVSKMLIAFHTGGRVRGLDELSKTSAGSVTGI